MHNTYSWEQRKIEDFFQFERQDNYMINDDHYQETGVPVLTANKAFILGYKDEFGSYDKVNALFMTISLWIQNAWIFHSKLTHLL